MQTRKSYTFLINNKEYTLELPSDIPLLWILRDHIKLTGTKYGCGTGQCGACTVLINNKAVLSCQLSADQINGQNITTIEGLSEQGLHSVQQAWVDDNVPQCGYCQSGQIMTAVSLLMQNPAPDNNEVDRAMSKVLCRCGTYTRVKKTITRLMHTASIDKI